MYIYYCCLSYMENQYYGPSPLQMSLTLRSSDDQNDACSIIGLFKTIMNIQLYMAWDKVKIFRVKARRARRVGVPMT